MKLFFSAFCCFLLAPASNCASARTVKVHLSGEFNERGLEGDSCNLPDVINIVITAGDVIITLEVFKSPRVTQDAPVYVIGDEGHLHLQIPQTLETYALYQDVKRGAAIMVSCPPGETRPLVKGSVMHEGRKYELRHSLRHRRDVSSDVYQLTEVRHERRADHVFDYTFPPSTIQHTLPPPGKGMGDRDNDDDEVGKEGSHRRPRRQAENTDNMYIDTVAVVAFDLYNKFLDESRQSGLGTEEDALDRTRKYFALLMSEVDLLYQRIGNRLPLSVNIRLDSIIVAQTVNASKWTEGKKENPRAGDRYELNATNVMPDVISWISGNSSLSGMDYFVLFTGYDVYTEAGYPTVGFAYVGSVCASNESNTNNIGHNVALVEVSDLFYAIDTTAHEIGHGLGAEHDGVNNTCGVSSYFIMAPLYGNITSMNRDNVGIFSNCSLTYFRQTLSRLSTSSRSSSCIHGKLSPAAVPDVADVTPGQLYDVHAQCRRAFGANSTVCQEHTRLGDAMCSQTSCTISATQCQSISLLRGTSCGNKKWCVNAVCVESEKAPSLDESCPFGDKNVIFGDENNATCAQLLSIFQGHCYRDQVQQACCATCPKLKNATVVGCEFGDKQSLPVTQTNKTCSQAAQEEPFWCYVDVFRTQCCQSCDAVRRNSETCPWGDRALQLYRNSIRTCQQYVTEEPWRCYDSYFQSQCCGTCQAVTTGRPGCEYGDKTSDCHSGACHAQELRESCCQTCAGISGDTSGNGGSNGSPVVNSENTPGASAVVRASQLFLVFSTLSIAVLSRVLDNLW